jgi:hypothetical protein
MANILLAVMVSSFNFVFVINRKNMQRASTATRMPSSSTPVHRGDRRCAFCESADSRTLAERAVNESHSGFKLGKSKIKACD